jgi:hypothetical protein
MGKSKSLFSIFFEKQKKQHPFRSNPLDQYFLKKAMFPLSGNMAFAKRLFYHKKT